MSLHIGWGRGHSYKTSNILHFTFPSALPSSVTFQIIIHNCSERSQLSSAITRMWRRCQISLNQKHIYVPPSSSCHVMTANKNLHHNCKQQLTNPEVCGVWLWSNQILIWMQKKMLSVSNLHWNANIILDFHFYRKSHCLSLCLYKASVCFYDLVVYFY